MESPPPTSYQPATGGAPAGESDVRRRAGVHDDGPRAPLQEDPARHFFVNQMQKPRMPAGYAALDCEIVAQLRGRKIDAF